MNGFSNWSTCLQRCPAPAWVQEVEMASKAAAAIKSTSAAEVRRSTRRLQLQQGSGEDRGGGGGTPGTRVINAPPEAAR